MSNYYPAPAIPAKMTYSLPLNRIMNIFSQRKQVEPEEIRKTIVVGDQDFTVVDFLPNLKDVKNTSLSAYLSEAVEYMEENAPRELAHQALPYIYGLDEKTAAYDSSNFPPLVVSFPNEGELLIEWNFEHFGIGLVFDINPDDSSWYIVNDGTVRKMTGWAYMNSQSKNELIDIILSQAVEINAVP